MPGFQKVEFNIPFEESGLIAADHVVGNVEKWKSGLVITRMLWALNK